MPNPLKIDFVSDVACPWCAIGLNSLERALAACADVVTANLHFHPYELNPQMPFEGVSHDEHIAEKYGMTVEQLTSSRQMLKERAAAVGFTFNKHAESRIYNTFGAHQLLHWAQTLGSQSLLKHALFKANFTNNLNISNPEVLAEVAESAGFNRDEAREVLASGRYAANVREAEQLWLSRGIQGVPGIIINDHWLISGGQPPEAFEQALRQIAKQLKQTHLH